MNEIGRAHQTVDSNVRLIGEMMEHQDTPAKTVRAHLEGRAISGKRVLSAIPGLPSILRHGIGKIVLSVVENNLKTPVCGKCHRGCARQIGEIRRAVSVKYILDVAIGSTSRVRAIAFIGLAQIDSLGILRFVLIRDDVSFVVITLANQPTEDSAGISPGKNSALRRLAVPCSDVVLLKSSAKTCPADPLDWSISRCEQTSLRRAAGSAE
jgi:hypothetical protein